MNFSDNYTDKYSYTTVPNIVTHNDAKYLIVPLLVIVLIVLLSILVYYLLKMRRNRKFRLNVLTLYEFDSREQEWESLSESVEYPNYNAIASSSL
ncbi:uncharacterized protein LOC123320325 [Coccinella septempunctata]|uniref:uncharacterized protein LOC123320325 n=1 Tax=Coccinella septempunctata TaxID=41139 RepID=UPI001D095980|nr:uncharacterized protein LOC123320325 [Coccinella septempunctata]